MRRMNKKGFSLVEILVTVAIISMMFAGGYAALSSGEASWFTAEAGIQVQEGLRQSLDKVTAELRQSRYSQVTLGNDTGVNSTDIVTFSIPVICHVGDNLLNSSGDVARWGATLRWGCRDANCMDANDTCSSVEYKSIRYLLTNQNLLVRQVLNSADAVVAQETIARNITDFQTSIASATAPMSLTLTGRVSSVLNRTLTATVQNNVEFRNK